MSNKEFLSVSEFAKFARTTRDTLLYYDKIGLLSPILRGDNNYRYYTSHQLAIVNLIRTLQAMGIPLAEIKKIKDNRSPRELYEFLNKHMDSIDDEIDSWVRSRKLLNLLKDTIYSHLEVNDNEINIQFMPAEPIILGDLNDYSNSQDQYDALFIFYNKWKKKCPDLDLNYPVWGQFSQDRIVNMDFNGPDRYYFYNPDGKDEKPASLYAIGYKRCGYGHGKDLYIKMLDYIDENGFKVCGCAYEEYPLNEICVLEEKNYLMRVMITVCKV